MNISLEIYKHIQPKLLKPYLRPRNSCCLNVCRYFSSANANVSNHPTIPKRIDRGPTDLLKALSATVGNDMNGQAFKFHDDPYLYAVSAMEKRNFSLSKEAGRKAAQWIVEQHPDCFSHQPDSPVIQKFVPKLSIDENLDKVTEKDLLSAITECRVSDSIKIYETLQSKKHDISAETQQSLLELVSFYNAQDGFDPEWTEEIQAATPHRQSKSIKTWKDESLAEQLFDSLKETGTKPYCAIIRGMCKYKQIDKGLSLYHECLSKGLVPDTGTFNSLLVCAPLVKEDNEERWTYIEELLHKMQELNLYPNLQTLNVILESLTFMRRWGRAKQLSLQILSEFKSLGIEPSLATYFHLLKIFYTLRNSTSSLLASIVSELEGKRFEIRDISDSEFFHTAMEICNRDIQNFKLAEKLHSILMTGDNDKFIGETYKENFYYRNYLTLAANSLLLPEFMPLYESLVPHSFSASSDVMEEIVKVMGVFDDLSHLPRIWSDCISMEVARNERLMETTLMVVNKHNLSSVSEQLLSQLSEIAWDIWTRVQGQNEGLRTKVEWSGNMLGDCLSVLARCSQFGKTADVIQALDNDPQMVIGIVPIQQLNVVFDGMLAQNMLHPALLVVKYAKECEYHEAKEMAKNIHRVASDDIKLKLSKIFGSEFQKDNL